MSYQLEIIKLKTFDYDFSHGISFHNENYSGTKFSTYEFNFITSNKTILSIISHVNLLPLFWRNQSFDYEKSYTIDLDSKDLTKLYLGLIKVNKMPTNFLFTLEMVLFKFLGALEINPIFDFFNTPKNVETAILMSANKIDLNLENKLIKLKIGINNIHEDKEAIKVLSQSNILRLDANKSLNPSQLATLLDGIDPSSIDSIEEPFGQIELWDEFSQKDKFYLAVDESLSDEFLSNKFQSLEKYIRYFVFKPSYNYSLSQIFSFLTNPIYKSVKPLISSSYEYEDSFNFLIALAAFCDGPRESSSTHGLGTYQIMNQAKFKQAIKLRSFPLSKF